MVKLRKYQEDCVVKCREHWRNGIRRILIVAPPGAGKGTLIAYFMAQCFHNNKDVLFFVHKRDLVFEIKSRLKEQFGIGCGLVLSGQKPDYKKRIQVGTVQTILNRIKAGKLNPDAFMTLTDECHRNLSPSQFKLIDPIIERNGFLTGFSATPVRVDKKSFDKIYQVMIQLERYEGLMEKKFLVPTRVYAPEGEANLEGLKIRMGDYAKSDLDKAFAKERMYKALFDRWMEYTKGEMSTMIFNVSQKHNREVCDYFVKNGINAVAVDDKTPSAVRDQVVKDFKKGKIEVLCNIGLFTEGVDAPITKCVVLNYATKSFSKYVQSTARGSRPVWNADFSDWKKNEDGVYFKKELLVLDFGGNTMRHGKLETYDMFGFDLATSKTKGEAPVKKCPKCRGILPASVMTCNVVKDGEVCGYIFPPTIKEDKKKFADEVDFMEIEGVQQNIRFVQKMSRRKVETQHPGYIRYIALIRNEDRSFKTKWLGRRRKEFEKRTGPPWLMQWRDKYDQTGDEKWKIPNFEFFKNGSWNTKAFMAMERWFLTQEKSVKMDKTYAEYKQKMI